MYRRLLCRICSLALCFLIGFPAFSATAEDCFLIDIDFLDMDSLRNNDYIAEYLSAPASGIRLQKYISNSDELAARVRLTIVQMDTNTLVFDKNYGYQSKTFDSGNIYLPSAGNQTIPYLITLYVEDWVYALPYMQLMTRLSYHDACTFGVRIADYNPALTSNWLMGTMIDLNQLRQQGQITLPVCASNAFIIGEALLSLSGETLTVSLFFMPEANVELHQSVIYCVPNVAELTSVEPHYMDQRAYHLGESIDVSSWNTILFYFPMTVSYYSAGLPQLSYDLWGNADLQRQMTLWNENGYLIPFQEEDPFPVPSFEPPIAEIQPDELFPQDALPPDLLPPDEFPSLPPDEAPGEDSFSEDPFAIP